MQRPITSSHLRARFLAFFEDKRHVAIPSAPLVPANDPTVLFTTAGMHPLVPYLLGAPHPAGTRLVDVQKCVRTGDIDAVGDDTHLTFFEMLGNWSLGDYYRDDAIRWSFEFLTAPAWLGLPLARLGVTCFAGDDRVPIDRDSARLWEALGIAPARIQFLGRDDNWWGPAGRTGPCGPDTEIFYWVGDAPAPDTLDVADRRWVEIWNNVFMGHAQTAAGEIVPLARVNIDTGMGLERTLVALGGLSSVYEIDTVQPLHACLRALAVHPDERALRIVTDHLRAACFLIADGVAPSNKDRGYVLRRLLRRSIVFARQLGLPADWYARGLARLVDALGATYPELTGPIAPVIAEEVSRFERTIAAGLREIARRPALDGAVAFDLFQTHGFPLELIREIAAASGKPVDETGFARELERHRERSRTVAAGAFAGGLADHGEQLVRYHTLTHLLQAALREVLGAHVIQRGSNITHERLRFDFSHDGKPAPAELAQVEARVNAWLARDLVVERATMTEPEARAQGAIGAFGERYGETVSVYTVRDPATDEVVSREFCGGPHVTATRALVGQFRILREQAVATGVRRIKAVLA
ncbi:MAG: alanine--tRNA ligase [Deltaproteobacteria bacterium]|nr:alanine--tRNA ligase [Deltaproteobacteria bacterium]